MRYRIPADPRRNQIRKRAQSALFRCAMLRTSRVQTMRTAAHYPRAMSRTNCVQCRAQPAALPPCNLCAVSRTIRCSSVAQSVRNAAHGTPLFYRAIRSQCRARPATLPSRSLCAMPRTTCCPMQPLKSYNRMQMQLASNPVLSQPPLAAMQQLSEKPHLGFATKKTAWNPGPNVCNFTVTLGLQVAMVENGVRKTYSARYYNPNTGRFLSRDPEDGSPTEPASLHKYLYANGDPINLYDPTGRAAEISLGLRIRLTIYQVTLAAGDLYFDASAAAASYAAGAALYIAETAASVWEWAAALDEALDIIATAKGVTRVLLCGGAAVTIRVVVGKVAGPGLPFAVIQRFAEICVGYLNGLPLP